MRKMTERQLNAFLIVMLMLFGAVYSEAVPLLGKPQEIEGVCIYPDSTSASIFYYAPGKLSIATDVDGSPEVSFLQMRYMGTAVTGDKGEFRTRSVLSFRIKMAPVDAKKIAMVKAKLRAQGAYLPNLKPLPIRKIEALLNYTPLKDEPSNETGAVGNVKPCFVGAGSMENVEDAKLGAGYWNERIFTISPDDVTSQALWDAFQTGKVILSLSYAFYADGIVPEQEKPVVEGNIEVADVVEGSEEEKQPHDPHIVLADAIAVTVDPAKHHNLLKQIDINESLPANYAALSVYCYDFNNSLRPDLYEKVVEIQAKSVNGKPLIAQASFSRTSPDVYSATIRFKFAVSLKDPYMYRIREITTSGEEKVKPWQPGKPWSQILDITTPPEEQPKPSENSDSGDE